MLKKLLLLLVPAVLLYSCTQPKSPEKPNIVFIFADDQCHNTIGAYGHPDVKTPNLDQLVENATSFTNAYNMGAWNGAVCQASRSMLNTGRFVWRAQAEEKNHYQQAKRGEMWSQLMKAAGYDTYMTGKWHVHVGAEKIFDSVVHVRPGMPGDYFVHAEHWRLMKDSVGKGLCKAEDIMPLGYNRPTSKGDTAWLPWDKKHGGFWEGGRHWSEVLADDATGFIDAAKQKDNPFFMYLAFNAPHDPRQAPKEYIDMYPEDGITMPESFAPNYPFEDNIGCGPALRDAALAPFPRTDFAVRKHRQEYFALITHLDAQIGKIIKALEESGQLENTYIFYSADHGLAVGDHGLFGKQNMYEHSVKPPLFVIGPDVPKNKKVDVDVYLQDIMASSLDLAGVVKPEYVEFSSLMPIVKGQQTASSYDAIYGCYKTDLQRMVKKDGFKLILYPHGKTIRLYDLNNDPQELNDLANHKAYKTKVSELYQALLSLQVEMDDPFDLKTVFGAEI
ncbi:sulfatase-like hydrolase/transferase [Bacteroidales bacterium]|nr:sulfatase-like hydrolase/transferase [Bacteroidales bacterium]